MRRTITTLMFLAAAGLAQAALAADQNSGSSDYYAAGTSSYRISDDDDEVAPAATRPSTVANAVGLPQQSGQEKHALYVADKATLGNQLLQTSYFDAGCGCNNACNNACNNGCNSCGNGACGDGCGCCPVNTVRLEMLGWWTRGRNSPALVTTSEPGTAQADAGILGLDTTSVLFGGGDIGDQIRTGLRVSFSHMFADGITYGDVRFWGIEDGSDSLFTNSSRNGIIGLPFFNTTLGIEDAFLVAFPGLTAPGQVRALAKNDLIGADAWIRRNWYDDGCLAVDVLGGYQFTRLDDSLTISALSTSVDPQGVLPVGTQIALFDSFRTQNEYHAGTAGLLVSSYRGNITLEGLFKFGLGNMRQRVIVDGNTTLTAPGGGDTTSTGGLFAQPTNIGTRERNRICFSPEINLNAIYNWNDSWRFIGGYSFIYWSNVVLAGNQIDRNINLTQVPGPIVGATAPAARFQRSDFWAQGLSGGVEYTW